MVKTSNCSTKSTTRKSNIANENIMNISSPKPSSPRYLPRAGRSPMSPSVGLFGVSKPITTGKPTASPLSISHLSLLNKSVLGDVQNQSLHENDFSPTRRLATLPQIKSNSPLPRVYRHHESRPDFDSYQAQSLSPKHYPTHQPKYEGVGLLPMVRLNQKNCLHSPNSSLSSPVTIKVAPPDILKPLPPVFLTHSVPSSQEASEDSEVSCPSTSTQSVLNALREKRKRNSPQDEDELSSPVPSVQENKRRRMSIPAETNDAAINSGEMSAGGQKRPTPDEPNDIEEAESKRVRKYSSSSQATSIISTGSSVRNSIEASFSSSRRWLDKQRNASRSNSILGDDRRGRSMERASCGTRSRSSSRIRADIIAIDDTRRVTESDLLSSAACTPLASLSGRSTPASLSQDEMSDSPNASMRRRPLLLKRKNLLHADVADSFSQVPQLRYTLTAEEIELDRQAERERVLGTLDEVEEALKQEKKEKFEAKMEKKQENPASSAAPVSVGTISSTDTAAAVTAAKSDTVTPASTSLSLTSLKSTVGFSMPTSSKPNPLTTSTPKASVSQSAPPQTKPSASIAANPLLVKPSFTAPEQSTLTSAASTVSAVSSSNFSLGTLVGNTSTPSAAPTLPKVATAPSSLSSITQVATTTAAASAPFTLGQSLASSAAPSLTPAPLLSFGQSSSSATGTSTATSKAAPFNFGQNSSAPTANSSSLTAAPAASASISSSPFTFGQNTTLATEPSKSVVPPAAFSFPGSSATFGSTTSTPSSTAAASAPFAFGKSDTKKIEPATTLTFGKTDALPSQFKMPLSGSQPHKSDASSSSVSSNLFTFGSKPAPQGDAAATKPAFTFGQTEAKKPESGFNAAGSQPFSATVTSATSTPFGASSNSNSTSFGGFGAGGATQSSTAAPFGATPSVTQANPFGVAPALSQSTPFNSSQPSPFGAAPTTTAQSKPFTFGATASTSQSAFGASNPSSIFSSGTSTKAPNVNPFGSTASSSASTPFGASNSKSTPFGATNSTSTPAFGSTGSSQPAPPAFGGSAASPFAPQTTVAPNANPFGAAANSAQNKPAFGAVPQTNGFNFGATTNAPKPTEGAFQFGASNAAKPADSGFQFGASSTVASVTPFAFGGSSAPSINRTASAPNFGASATPPPNQGSGFSIGANPAQRRPMARAARRRPVRK